MNATVKLDVEKMRALRVELDKIKGARVKVGLLGAHSERFDEDWNKQPLNNPTLGLIHEFGTKGPLGTIGTPDAAVSEVPLRARAPIPARSFLRMPLLTRLPDELDKIGRAVWRALIVKEGGLAGLKALGELAVGVVQRAFETGGFGQWAPLSPVTISRKKSSAILIDTDYMRKAVTYEVKGATP